MVVEILQMPEPGAPYGAKGIGESTVTPVAPAIANALSDAVGSPVNRLPLTPETVLAAVDALQRSSVSKGRPS
jgi:CO/xanthine dehydrogenase Mo-binding subunit